MSIEKSIAKFVSRIKKAPIADRGIDSNKCENSNTSVADLDKIKYPKRQRGALCVRGLCDEDVSEEYARWKLSLSDTDGYWFSGQTCGSEGLCSRALENGGKILHPQTSQEQVSYLRDLGCIK